MAKLASIAITSIAPEGVTVKLEGGDDAGKLSSSGKTMVLASDKLKFKREDGKEVTVQVTMYTPV